MSDYDIPSTKLEVLLRRSTLLSPRILDGIVAVAIVIAMTWLF